MAKYEVNGQIYELPDDVSPDEALSLIGGESGEGLAANTGSEIPPRTDGKIDPATLKDDPDWLDAAKTLWHWNENRDFEGSAQDLSEYALDQMGWFNYNIVRMGYDANRLRSAPPEAKKAFLSLMNTYDDLELSWGGALRFGKGVLADPTTYVGLTTLGIGTGVSSATKLASKEALKSALRAGVIGSVEGAIVGAGQNAIEQDVRMTTGERSQFDWSEAGKAAGLGAAAGAVLGGAVDGLGTALRKSPAEAPTFAPEAPKPVEAPRTDPVAEMPSVAPLATNATPTAPAANSNLPLANDNAAMPTVRAANDEVAPPVMPMQTVATDLMPPQAANDAASPADVMRTMQPSVATDAKAPGFGVNENFNGALPKGGGGGSFPDNPVLAAVREFANNSGLRVYPRTREAITQASAKAVDAIMALRPEQVAEAMEQVRRADLTGEQVSLARGTLLRANQKLHEEVLDLKAQMKEALAAGDRETVSRLRQDVDRLLERQDAIRKADLAESSVTGLDLGARRGHLETGGFREVSIEGYLKEMGVPTRATATPEQLQRATDQYLDALGQQYDMLKAREPITALEKQIDAAKAEGDLDRAVTLAKEKNLLEEQLAQADPKTAGYYDQFNNVLKYVNEYVISTVFTTKTLLINVIPSAAKMAYRPGVDFLVKGANGKAFREMTATYAAFGTNFNVALKAAMFAFKVERGLLNGVATDINKVLEEEVMFKGAFGRYLRFFPRVLGATDEFFGQLNYRSFVQAQAVGDAYDGAVAAGLKGEAFDKFIQDFTRERIEASFTNDYDAVGVIDFLRKTGSHQYGLKGAKLDHFIKTELHKNQDLFNEATITSGKDYANDLAFKRNFSGDGAVSKAAKGYEAFVNANPWMRLMGQLFFRTPIRVFEEGFRLTAGLNLITPHFLRDLRGQGPGGPGGFAQVRAQGEAFLSMAILVAVMNGYARGALTGGGPDDWRARRSVDGGEWNPYMLRVGDKEFSYRNFDPFSTPLKVIVNALDRFQDIQIRKAQGEFIGPEAENIWLAYATGASLAVAQALKDANLTEGIEQLYDLSTNLINLEDKSEQVLRFFGQKAQLAVPNQVQKAQQFLEDPSMKDPATPWQHVLNRVDPSDPLVPKRYDTFGVEVKGGVPLAAITGIDLKTKGERDNYVSEAHKRVSNELAALTQLTGKSFIAPYKAKAFAAQSYGTAEGSDFDLRTVYVKDGSETMYDRLQRYTFESGVVQSLDREIRQLKRQVPVGTQKFHDENTLSGMVQETLQWHRNEAWRRLYKEETQLQTKHKEAAQYQAVIKSGRRDVYDVPLR